jgi:hypothetical protein
MLLRSTGSKEKPFTLNQQRKETAKMKLQLKATFSGMTALMAGVLMAAQHSAVYVPGLAPDWNQPYSYGAAGPGADPNPLNPPLPPPDQWDAWCAPTSAANLVGYVQDTLGKPIADGTAYQNTTAWGNASWHDYQADSGRPAPGAAYPGSPTDLGWYMDTNRSGAIIGVNGAHTGTYVKDIQIGLQGFLTSIDANGGWQSRTQGRNWSMSSNNFLYFATPLGSEAAVFNDIKLQIDAGMPVVVSWLNWNLVATGDPDLQAFGTGESTNSGKYFHWVTTSYPHDETSLGEEWNGVDTGMGLGHTVLAVGYIPKGTLDDPSGGLNDWVIVHDNNPLSQRNVIVPLDYTQWVANTEIVPEPATFVLLMSGMTALFWRRRNRM